MSAANVTLCFLLRDAQSGGTWPGGSAPSSLVPGPAAPSVEVLLGLKKTGFGRGKVVGIGGHVEQGESVAQAICREVQEETAITIGERDLIPAGTVEFEFPGKPEWDMFTTVFLCRSFVGVATESSEIAPQWYPIEQLPQEQMWADASHWLPTLLSGERAHWRIILNEDNETVASSTRLEAGPWS